MVEGAGLAQRHREVVVAEPQHVDAGQGGDLVGRGRAARILDLQDDGGARVLLGEARHQRLASARAKRSCARPSATPRVPSGQYLAASSTALACSTEATIGTITPSAPVSRAREM